ncbi:MAG: RraA family protein [Azospirillaceae bacterium]
MTASPIDASVLDALRRLDTPTVCNALERVVPERRGHGYTIDPLVCPYPDLPPMVGFARTATMAAMYPPAEPDAEVMDRRVAYYRYIAEGGPLPSVVVIHDTDPHPGYGAFWGEVNTNIHKGLGALGLVTNGSVRDIDENAEGFALLAGLVGPSHAWARVESFGGRITVAGMTVDSGDLIHADRHGAVVIPPEAAAAVPEAAAAIAREEAVLIEAAKRPGFGIDALETAMGRRKDIH